MKQKLIFFKSLTDFYEWVEMTILILSLSFLLNDSLSIGIPWFGILFGGVFWIILIRFVRENYKNLLTYMILAGFILLIYLIIRSAGATFEELVQQTVEFGFGRYIGDSGVFVASLLGLFITFCFALFCTIAFRYFPVRMVIAGVYILLLPLFAVFHISLSKITLFFMFAFFLVNLAVILEYVFQKKMQTALYLLPFVLFICFISVILPSKNEPIRWTFVRSFVSSVTDLADEVWSNLRVGFGESGSYSIAFAGYSESGKIKGKVLGSDQVALTVNGKKTRQNVYLTGSVYDTYQLNGWSKSQEGRLSEEELQLDVFEFYNALYQLGYSKETLDQFIGTHSMDLIYQNIKTKSVFYPLKAYSITIPDKFKLDQKGTEYQFQKIYRKGVQYKTKFLVVDYEQADAVNLLENQNMPYGTYEQVCNYIETMYETASISMLEEISSENLMKKLNERKKDIQELYTALPSNISQRVQEKAVELTEGKATDYEKAKAIETYLNEFPYTKSPSIPEEGEEITDFLLYESKEGYCTYFATAMAVLLRCVDIPARYVEGFYLDYKDISEYHTYEIPSDNAHAWCEVYIDGVGWIPFEPTGAIRETRYLVREESKQTNNKPASYEYRPSSDANLQLPSEKKTVPLKNYAPIFIIALELLVFLICSIIIYAFVMRRIKKKRFQRATSRDKTFYLFLQMLKILELESGKSMENESLEEMLHRLREHFLLTEDSVFTLQQNYQNIRYGNYDPDSFVVDLFVDIKDQMEHIYLKKMHFLQKQYYYVFRTII